MSPHALHTLAAASLAAVLSTGFSSAVAAAEPGAAECAGLLQISHPNTTVQRALPMAADAVSAGPVKMLARCFVSGEMFARTGVDGVRYSMGFEWRLPFNWNGRFVFQGGGGVDGTIRPAFGVLRAGVTPALSQGAAVVTSDMGHTGTSNTDARFGLDPQARIDWGYNALIGKFYGKPPTYAYFVGWSGGGRQGLILAQRFPQHFDGIVSGAPILEQHLARLGSMQMLQAFAAISPKTNDGAPILSQSFSDADMTLIADGVLRRCDALDGAADGLIDNHVACTYSVAELQCPGA